MLKFGGSETLLSARAMRYVSRKSTSNMKMVNNYCQARQSKKPSLKKTNPSKDLICQAVSESILRVKSEPESCPSPSQVESQVSGIPFFSQTTRSSSIRMVSGKCEFFQIICIYSMSL